MLFDLLFPQSSRRFDQGRQFAFLYGEKRNDSVPLLSSDADFFLKDF